MYSIPGIFLPIKTTVVSQHVRSVVLQVVKKLL